MKNKDDDMLTDDFDSGLEGELDIICNMIFVLPIEFDQINEVIKEEDDYFAAKMENHMPLCYYVMNNGCIEEEISIF